MSTSQEIQSPEATTRFRCRHIFADGARCGSFALRNEPLCYFHHNTRKPVAVPVTRRRRRATFTLPLPEDRCSIQIAIGEVLQRIAANDLDPRRAGLLLYGLQIASSNLPPRAPSLEAEPNVTDVTIDQDLGPLAPVMPEPRKDNTLSILMQKLHDDFDPTSDSTLPQLNASAGVSELPHSRHALAA